MPLFDDRDLAEISAPEQFPGERLVVCRNTRLGEERARKRKVLLDATEKELTRIKARVRPTPPVVTGTGKSPHLYAAANIGVAVGAVLDDSKMGKHFELVIRDGHFSWHRRTDAIERESRLDGRYVIRTSVPAADLSAAEMVEAYKDLARVERADVLPAPNSIRITTNTSSQ